MGIFQNGKNLLDPSFRDADGRIDTANGETTEKDGVFSVVARDADVYVWHVAGAGDEYRTTSGYLIEIPNNVENLTISISNEAFDKNYVTFYNAEKVSLGYVRGGNTNIFTASVPENAKYCTVRFGVENSISGTTYETTMTVYYCSGKSKLFAGDKKVKKAYLGTEKIYSAGNIVTYCVDNGVTYQEEVDSDASCLNPTTFTPSKSGWTFVGWREDTTASSDVLSSKIMGDEPVTLYAVFEQSATLYYYDGGTTKQSKSGNRYYNNGNIFNPSFTMSQTSKSGWTARGWATGTAGNASVAYSNGATITISADTTIYGLYQQTITLTYYNNSTTKQTKTGTRYWNSGSNAYVNPTFTLSQASKSGWTARGWATGTAGNASVAYSSINGTAFSANTTVYGLYYKTIIQRFIHANRATANSEEVYYNSYGNTTYPYITMPTVEAKDGWTAIGWTDNNPAASASADYSSGQTDVRVTIDENYFYAVYQKNVMLYYQIRGTGYQENKTAYYNASGNASYPRFTVSDPSLSGATFQGWGDGTTALYTSTISNYEIQNDMYVYAVFKYNDTTVYSTDVHLRDDSGWGDGQPAKSGTLYSSSSLSNYVSASFTVTGKMWVDGWSDNGHNYIGGGPYMQVAANDSGYTTLTSVGDILYASDGTKSGSKTYNISISGSLNIVYNVNAYWRTGPDGDRPIGHYQYPQFAITLTGKTVVG